jgi:hypothetical protein
MAWLSSIVLAAVVYFLSSGAAFVAVYKFPGTAPIRFFKWFYLPLDWLAVRNLKFRALYNGFQNWCYRRFVDKRRDS